MSVKEGATLEVAIDAVDDEGRGRGVVGELDVAVRGALPGDRVTARVDRVFAARGLAQARCLDVVERGPLHVERACPHRAPCPGCPLEGVDEGFARELKRARVVQALVDAGLPETVPLVDDVRPSLAPRQKAKLTAGGAPGALRLGLFVPHSHVLVGAEECPHQHEKISDALDVLLPALDETGLPPATIDPRGIKAVVVRVFREGTGAVVVLGAPISGEHWRTLGACVDGKALAALAVRVDEPSDAGASRNSLVGGDVQRFVGPQKMTPLEGGSPEDVDAFCQSDPLLASWMYARVAELLAPSSDDVVLDLYAGTGGFSRALLERGAKRVTAVERAPASVASLRALAVDVLASSVEDALPALLARGPVAAVVADPPKSGLKDAARGIASLGAGKIALVACDPDAGARDARVLVDAGYRIDAVEPLDLFPATPEVETLVLLSRR
jgi:tRNA/tmRNA/rRNA uracil-C5-methylase (TrmA/RlmC/RlmD family)